MTLARGGLIAALLLAAPAWADIFSPGDLAKPHANLEGITNCTQCHPAGGQLSQETCLNCHTELKPRIDKGFGLHGRITADKRACESCHPDHRGRAFALIDWGAKGEKGFDHARTGWAYKGKHAELKCTQCHEKRLVLSAAIVKLIEKSPERQTRLGLNRECHSCHFDEHRGQEGADCASCHSEKAWKPAPDFNHADTQYPLTGKHQKVKCEKCHPSANDDSTPKGAFPAPVSETFMKYTPVEHKTCLDCHKDFHEGKFGLRCQSCHTTDGWRIIRNATQERAFHEKTKFPLKGEHLDTPCVSCHGPFPGQAPKFKGLPFDTCATCHADAHLGQFTAVAGKREDCEVCHTVNGFAPPKYTLEQHQKTRYPLEGAHQAVPCNACHARTPALAEKIPKPLHAELKRKNRPELFSFANFDFKAPLDKCETCHKDPHQGQFDARAGGCAACHAVTSFKKVKFDHDKDSRFPLEGKHAEVKCEKCHGALKGRVVLYKPLQLACAGCHEDVHAAQFAAAAGKPTDCTQCHDAADWKKTKFKHQPPFTTFLLEGKHVSVKCEACHQKFKLSDKVTAVRYVGLAQTCEGCHSDFHQGGFKGFEP